VGQVTRQAEALGWPAVCGTGAADDGRLDALLRWCLTDEARAAAAACVRRGRDDLAATRGELLDLLRAGGGSPPAAP